MKRILDQKNLPVLMLFSYLLKSGIYYQPLDSVIVVALAGLFGFKLWLDHIKKPDYSQEVDKQIKDMQLHYDEQINILNNKISGFNLMFQKNTGDSTNKETFGWGR